MPRIRTYKLEDFFLDDKIGSLSFAGRLCYLGLKALADDFGTLSLNPVAIKAMIFAHDYNDPEADIDRILKDMENLGLIIRYGPNKKYIYLPRFHDEERINRPSKKRNAPPPENYGVPVSKAYAEFVKRVEGKEIKTEIITELEQEQYSLSTHASLSEYSLNTHETLSEYSLSTHLRNRNKEQEKELELEKERELEERGRGFKGEGENNILSSTLKASRTENKVDNAIIKSSPLEEKSQANQKLVNNEVVENSENPVLSVTCENEAVKKEAAAELERANKRSGASVSKVVEELAAGEPVERDGEVLRLPVVGHPEIREVVIGSAFVEDLKRLYPAVDVKQELWEMRGWLLANPDRRKTLRGIKRFINSWLAREQDRAGRRGARDAPVDTPSEGFAAPRGLSPKGRRTWEACMRVLRGGGTDVGRKGT